MMKRLFLFCLVPLTWACSSSPAGKAAAGDPTHIAVTAFLKKSLDDPASYQPARWGKVANYQQKEVDAEQAELETLQYKNYLELADISNKSYLELIDLGADRKVLERTHKSVVTEMHRADSVKSKITKLSSSSDTTRLGRSVWHAFRAKNKMGALVLDSARFIVLNTGEVKTTK